MEANHRPALTESGKHISELANRLNAVIFSANPMLRYALIFLVVALIAGFLGFASLAGTAAWIAKGCFLVFLVLFVISLIKGKAA